MTSNKKKFRMKFFSVIATLAMIMTMIIPTELFASADTEVADPSEMTITANSIQLNKADITENTVVKNGDILSLDFAWTLADNCYEISEGNLYTFKIDLSDKMKNVYLTNQTIYGVKGDDVVAKYVVDGQYLYITPLAGTTMGREGFCELSGTVDINAESVDNDGKFKFEVFGDKFPAYAPSYVPQLNVYKSAVGEVKKVGDKYYQNFEVNISGTIKDIENVIISDTVSAGNKTGFYTTGMPENITLNSTPVAKDKITSTAVGFDVNIGTVSPSTTYKLEYSLEVDPIVAMNPTTSYDAKKNSVKGKYNEKETYPSDTTASVQTPSVAKTGNYDADTKTASWTITVNTGILYEMGDGDKFTISDTLGEHLDDSVLLAINGVVKNADGTYTIPASSFTKSADGKSYTLTYTTLVDDDAANSVNKINLVNTADVTFTEYPDIDFHPANAQTQTTGIVGDLIGKEFAGITADGNLHWNVTVDVPDIAYEIDTSNIEYYNFKVLESTTQWVSNRGTHNFDVNSLKVMGSDGNEVAFSDVAKVTYNEDYATHKSNYATITFKKAFIDQNKGKSFSFTIDTAIESGNSKTYKNQATLSFKPDGLDIVRKSAEASYTADITFSKGHDESYSYVGVTKADYNYPAMWNIKISSNAHAYKAGEVITVTDTLPENYSLIDGAYSLFTSETWNSPKTSKNYKDYVDVSVNGNKVTFTITLDQQLADIYNHTTENIQSGNTNKFYLYYATKMNDDAVLDFVKTGEDKEIVNTANVSVEGFDSDVVTDRLTVTPVKDGIIDKSIDETLTRTDADGKTYVTYKVVVNSAKAQLGNGVDDIVLTDELGTNLVYNEGSMSISGGENDFNAENDKITFTLKDKTAYVITYEARVIQVSKTEGEKLSEDEINRLYGNTIVLNGSGSNLLNDVVVVDSSTFESKGGMIYDENSTYITIKGTKTWADQYNVLARPKSITVVLECTSTPTDGSASVTKTESHKVNVPADDSGSWSYTFENLQTKDNKGMTYKWNIKEVDVDGYAFTGSELTDITSTPDAEKGTDNQQTVQNVNIKNTFTADKTEVGKVKVTKNWNDDNNVSNIRPAQIKITITDETGNYSASKLLDTSESDQSVTFDNLPLYTYTRDADDNLIRTPRNYTVSESAEGNDSVLLGYYTAETPDEFSIVDSYSQTATAVTKNVELTNTFDGATSVTGTKTWVDNSNAAGIRPDSLVVILSANGTVTNNVPVWTNTSSDIWTYTFKNLPKYSIVNGTPTEIVYTVAETVPVGYTEKQTGLDFTNTLKNETTQLTGTKTWVDNNDAEGIRPDSITVTLYADNVATTNTAIWTNTDKNVWNYSFANLPKYSYTKTNGVVTQKEISYSVLETPVENYTTTYNGNDITNTYVAETTEVEGTKTWVDNSNEHGVRPDGITITLFADGNETTQKPVWTNTDKDEWNYSFVNLPKYTFSQDGAKSEIIYTVSETAVECYTTEQNGFDFTNTEVQTNVSISKTDITGDNEIAGATLQVTDMDGNIIDEWVSTTTAHEINGVLCPGKSYILKETNAPDGYAYAVDVVFTVSTDGSVDVVTIADDITRVSISKTDITGETQLAGATLQIMDAEGNMIDEWVTGTSAHEINGVLNAGQVYTLHESAAPQGYKLAEDISFTVNMDATVNTIIMKDEAEDTSSESSSENSSDSSDESSSESSSDIDSSSSDSRTDSSDSSKTVTTSSSSSRNESTSSQTSSTPNTGVKTGAFATGIVALAALTVFKRKNDKNK